MPKAVTKDHYESQQCKFTIPADHFEVDFGYKDRNSIQLRLEKDGSVSAFDSREERYPSKIICAVNVPWGVFQEAWPQFVEHLAALGYNATDKDCQPLARPGELILASSNLPTGGKGQAGHVGNPPQDAVKPPPPPPPPGEFSCNKVTECK